MKKNIFAKALILMSLAALFFFGVLVPSTVVSAYDPLDMDEDPEVDKKNPDTGYRVVIYDGAELLSSSEIKDLAADMAPIADYCNVAFVTTDKNSYHDIMDYSDEIYYQIFKDKSGVMIIIDMAEREISTFARGKMESVVTESYGYDITDNIYRYASNGDYYNCASSGFEQIYRLLNGQRIARPMKYVCTVLMALLISLLINFLIVSRASKIQRTSAAEMLEGAKKNLRFTTPALFKTGETKTYSPQSSGSGGGGGSSHRSGGGGHHSGGGHHGGGGGHHRF